MRRGLAVWVIAASAAVFGGLGAVAPLRSAAANPQAPGPELSQATETLRLSIDEWTREDAAYRAARGAGKVSRAEQEDYAGYVASLRLRVLEQCEVVRGLGGEAAVAPFACVRTGPEESRARTAVVPPAAVMTDEEKKAAVQARLNELEGDIDERLQKRQQEIRQTATAPRRPPSPSSAAGGGGGGGSSGSAGGAGSRANTSTGTWSDPEAAKKPPGEAAAGEKSGAQGAGTGGATDAEGSAGTGQTRPAGAAGPNDRERQAARRQRPTDGSADDDIVARQLREAAEKETDPVLKEKLWAEYRKYKEAKR